MKKNLCFIILVSFFYSFQLLSSENISSSTTASPKEQVTLKFYTIGSGKEMAATRSLIEMFEKTNPSIKVEVLHIPFGTDSICRYYSTLLNVGISDKNMDLLAMDCSWAVNLSDNLLDLSKVIDKEQISQHYSSILSSYKLKERIFALPWYCDVGLLYYRKDLLKQYNLNVPATWEELEKAAKIIQNAINSDGNFSGFVWQGYAYEGLTCNALEWIYGNAGGDIVDDKKQITIDNKNAVEALKMAKRWIGTISPENVLTMQEAGTQEYFVNGNAAFARSWPYLYDICNSENSEVRGKFGVTMIPKGKLGKHAGVLGGWGIGINKNTKNKEEAIKLLLFLTSLNAQEYRAFNSGNAPTTEAFYNNEKIMNDPRYGIIKLALDEAFNRPITQTYPNYDQVSREFYMDVYFALNNKISPEAALKKTAETLKKNDNFKTTKTFN